MSKRVQRTAYFFAFTTNVAEDDLIIHAIDSFERCGYIVMLLDSAISHLLM